MIRARSLKKDDTKELSKNDLKVEVLRGLEDILDSSSDDRKIFKICLVEAEFATEEERKGKADFIKVTIYTSRPGFLIGRQGRYIDFIKASLEYVLQYNVEIGLIETYNDYL